MSVKIFEALEDTFIACPFQRFLKKGDQIAIDKAVAKVVVLGYGKKLKHIADENVENEHLSENVNDLNIEKPVFTEMIKDKSMAKRKKVKTK